MNQVSNLVHKISVMLVEDHIGYREVLEIALDTTPDIQVISTFGAAEIAHRSLQHENETLKPDVILLDLNLPGMNGFHAIPIFKSVTLQTKIIVLSQSNRQADFDRASVLGASGYLLKSATVTQIVEGIRGVMRDNAELVCPNLDLNLRHLLVENGVDR